MESKQGSKRKKREELKWGGQRVKNGARDREVIRGGRKRVDGQQHPELTSNWLNTVLTIPLFAQCNQSSNKYNVKTQCA